MNTGSLSRQKGFIKSILYNQVPLTAFFNRRSLLASSTILMGFTLVTFVLPFFSLISERPGYQVSLQVTGALIIFAIATLISVHVMKCIGAKKITWFALALAVAACLLLSKAPKIDQSENNALKLGNTWEWLEKPIEGVLFYYDGAIAGYLLICIAAAFLSTASF